MKTSIDDLPLRDELRGRRPYGAPQRRMAVTLNVNENAHPVPEVVRNDIVARIDDALRDIHRYPDREFSELRRSLAHYLNNGLGPDNIWAANGSNEILQQILQAFGGPGRKALGFAPTYSMYPILASGTGTSWALGERDERYELTPGTAVRWMEREKPDVTFLCSPNNPTGTPVSLDVVAAVYDVTAGMVVVDEAYGEFASASEPSATTLLPGRERLIVSRTMSKAFAFAGARLGYLAADPAVTDALRLVRLPYHLSALTQAAALGALVHTPTMLKQVDNITAQRNRLSAALSDMGFEPFRSSANFVLFAGVADPPAIFSALCDRGVLIRDVGISHALRVTAGTEDETTAFLSALHEVTQR